MTEKPVRWGLLSTARINERLINAINQDERSKLLAVGSRSKRTAEQYAEAWGIPRAYGTYEDLLRDQEVNAVYISLPNSYHAEWSIKTAAAGKHILCEKPLALTPEDVDRMAEAACRARVVLQEAAMYRFHPQTLKVRELVAQGAIGDVRLIRGLFTFTLPKRPDIRLDPALGGGCLWDLGSYPVSFIRTMRGAEPVEVAGWQVLGDTGVDLTFMGQMRFVGGTLAQFTCSFEAVPHWDAELIGTEGMIYLDFPWQNIIGEPSHLRITRGGRGDSTTFGDSKAHLATEVLAYENNNAYQCELDAMVDTILDGKDPVISLADSRGNIATLVGLYRSARSGRPVKL